MTELNKKDNSKDKTNPINTETNDKKFWFHNAYFDIIAYILIIVAIFSSSKLNDVVNDWHRDLKTIDNSLFFPCFYDLFPDILIYLVIFYVVYKAINSLAFKYTINMLDNQLLGEKEELLNIFRRKMCSNFFKAVFYLSSAFLGYYCLKDLNYFPKALLGNGDYSNLFKRGIPGIYNLEHFNLIDLYYKYNLGYIFLDFFLLLSHPIQSDFLFLILHHIVTLSLVFFSYITNQSSVGCLILFLHFSGDVFVYNCRILIQTNLANKYKLSSVYALLIVFIYTRIYVFGSMIYTYFTEFPGEKTYVEYSFLIMKSILLILHFMWVGMIIAKLVKYLKSGKFEDIYKFKKEKETN